MIHIQAKETKFKSGTSLDQSSPPKRASYNGNIRPAHNDKQPTHLGEQPLLTWNQLTDTYIDLPSPLSISQASTNHICPC